MQVRVRFAPSPTGPIHIGNIRTAIFNWLFARHHGGSFLLRLEDTDRERSTPEAVETLEQAMAWFGLDHDEEPLYQSTRREQHLAAAEHLLEAGAAYRYAKGEGDPATVFRIPLAADACVRPVGAAEFALHPEHPVRLDPTGIRFAEISRKGKPMPRESCLAGMRDLRVLDAAGNALYDLAADLPAYLDSGKEMTVEGGVKISFTRYEVFFEDLVKGVLTKPLDSLKDQVIVRSNGLPVFHLANVCDDIEQQVTHIIRGDDHVENTHRHLFLFQALAAEPPAYAHLPMIVNAAGKPYSKRDGDCFVDQLRTAGLLPATVLNYLALLGWSPGDDREKMSRDELVELFTIDRVRSAPSQMDFAKLLHLNGQYMAEVPEDQFIANVRAQVQDQPWMAAADAARFDEVARLMQSRTKLYADAEGWAYFFPGDLQLDEALAAKHLRKPGVAEALAALIPRLEAGDFSAAAVEAAIHATTEACGIGQGKLNLPLRLAVTGCKTGAGIYETINVMGRDLSLARLRRGAA